MVCDRLCTSRKNERLHVNLDKEQHTSFGNTNFAEKELQLSGELILICHECRSLGSSELSVSEFLNAYVELRV